MGDALTQVVVKAVRNGEPLRELLDGSSTMLGLGVELAFKIGGVLAARRRTGWRIGVLSHDGLKGQRVLHRELYPGDDPEARVSELAELVSRHGLDELGS